MRIILTTKENETTQAAHNAAKLLVDSVKVEGDFIFDEELAVRQLTPILERATIDFFKDLLTTTRKDRVGIESF